MSLGLVDGRVRRFVPARSALGDALAVLDVVLATLRGRDAQMATLTARELASHLTRAHLLAPFLDLDGCNTSVFGMPRADLFLSRFQLGKIASSHCGSSLVGR